MATPENPIALPRPAIVQEPSASAVADRVASRFLERIAPMRFEVALSDPERQASYRLRYEAVVERGWLKPDELSDGMERDHYDEVAVPIVGWDGEQAIATSRLVFPTPGQPLPTEEAFDLVVEPRGQVVDLGRFVVARSHSDREHRVLAALLARSWLEMRQRGFVRASAAFASPAMLRVYRFMGFQVTPLGPARHYWGEERYPVRFDVLESAARLAAIWNPEAQDTRM